MATRIEWDDDPQGAGIEWDDAPESGGAFPRSKKVLKENKTKKFMERKSVIDAALMDMLGMAGTAMSKIPGVSALGEASDAFNKAISPGERDYPLQGSVEMAKTALDAIPLVRDLETPKVALEILGQTPTDPLNALAGMGALAKTRKFARAGKYVAEAPEKLATQAASASTGISKEALSQASTAEGRLALKKAAEKAPSLGERFVENVSKFSSEIPEAIQIEEMLRLTPDIDIRPFMEALEQAKIPGRGPMKSSAPAILNANKSLDNFILAARGELPTPEQIAKSDFGGNLAKAKAALKDPESVWGILNDINKKAQKAAEKASSSVEKYESAARRAAGKAASTPKRIAKPEGRGTIKNPAYEEAVARARAASDAAKKAYDDAIIKQTVGMITESDAAKAKSALDKANRELIVSDAAHGISQGEDLNAVSGRLRQQYGIENPELLQSYVKEGRARVGRYSFEPNYKMSASDFRKLREDIDASIAWGSPDAPILDEMLKGPRKKMAEMLEEASIPQYKADMQTFHRKLQIRDELRRAIGKQEGRGASERAQNFLRKAAKEQPGGPNRKLLEEFEAAYSGEKKFLPEVKEAGRALEFGPEGIPQLFPDGKFRSILSGGLTTSALMSAGVSPMIAGAAGLSVTSPRAATSVAIPLARGAGQAAKKVGKNAQKVKPKQTLSASALLNLIGGTEAEE